MLNTPTGRGDVTNLKLTVDPGRAADPARFFAAGSRLLDLLDQLTDVEATEGDWRLADLRIASAVAVLESDAPERQQAALRLVHGLRDVRAGDHLPSSWTPNAISDAQGLIRALGNSTGTLEAGDNVVPLDNVLAIRLEELTPWVREMPGSVRGTLTGFNINRGNRASLKLDTGRVVHCSFPSSQQQNMANALMKFVELEGTVRQDGDGQTYWINAEAVHEVPDAPMAWEDLIGYDRNITDGLPVSEYLAVIRGES